MNVVEHSGLRYRLPATGTEKDDRLLYVGDDSEGVALQVMAIELSGDELFVIHAMELRPKYLPYYEKAMRWRT